MPYKRSDLPSTLQRSSDKAQRTFIEAHDSAVESYGEGRRAHQTAWAAVKHSFEKRDGKWVEKDEKGPSDPRAKKSPARGETGGETFGGVDVEGNNKKDLYERARKLDISGRSKMTKHELARAISRAQD